ncbi:MAG: 50S ribosomal protein L21 [Patescibacteria group bacterium]
MTNFAVIKTGGKQYIAEPGKKLKVEKLLVEEGVDFSFENVLLVAEEGEPRIGTPLVEGAAVLTKVLRHGRAKKITNLRYHSKTRRRRKQGHRQWFTEVEILGIA